MEPVTHVADATRPNDTPPSGPADSLPVGVQSYQQLLRAVGAVLDRDHAGFVTVVEVGDGFIVRRQVFRNTHVETAVTHLTFGALLERLSSHRDGRPSTTVVRGPCLWSGMAPSHQDFFRSFGFELDDIGARAIVVDELSESLFVSCERNGEARSLVLTRPHLEEVLNEAVKRRKMAEDAAISQKLGILLPGKSAPVLRDLSGWAPMRDDVPYGNVLRELGDLLDRREARDVCLLETPNGISTRYRLPGEDRLSWEHFPYADIEKLMLRRERKFRLVGRKGAHSHDRYRSLFQGLGHELERIYASAILVDEGEDSFTVTFEYVDSRQSYASLKGFVELGKPERAELVKGARTGRWPAESVLVRPPH